jgi:hypothetical protein
MYRAVVTFTVDRGIQQSFYSEPYEDLASTVEVIQSIEDGFTKRATKGRPSFSMQREHGAGMQGWVTMYYAEWFGLKT